MRSRPFGRDARPSAGRRGEDVAVLTTMSAPSPAAPCVWSPRAVRAAPGSETRSSTRGRARAERGSTRASSGQSSRPRAGDVVARSPVRLPRALTATPRVRSSLSIVATSCSRGTFDSCTRSLVSSAAHSSGRAAFLAPEIATSPSSRRPPRMRSLSIERIPYRPGGARRRRPLSVRVGRGGGGALGSPFLGRQRLHRERVNLLAHSIAEGPVDPLVAGDAAAAGELGGDDGREEMAPVAVDLEMVEPDLRMKRDLGGVVSPAPMLARASIVGRTASGRDMNRSRHPPADHAA